MTEDQILKCGRGAEVFNQIEILKMICQQNLEAIANTCIPIITKVKPVAEERECEDLISFKYILDE